MEGCNSLHEYLHRGISAPPRTHRRLFREVTRGIGCFSISGPVQGTDAAYPLTAGGRFEWLYVTVFVSPATGETFWYISNGVSKRFFEALLETFAREAGAGMCRSSR